MQPVGDPAAPDTRERVSVPSREDPVVAGVSRLIGGPPGRHAWLGNRRRWALPLLLLMVTVTCLLAWAQKSPCRDPGKWQDEYQYTRLCYSDIVALYNVEGLADGKRPYLDHDVEYPAVIGGLMQGAASVVDWFDSGSYELFFDVTAGMLTVAALVVVASTALTHRRRPWDAALVALAPALVFHAFTNWDLAAAAFAALAVLAWSRERPGWAGVFLGLGIATKLYPVLFLVPLFALCWRSGRLRAWTWSAATAVLTVVLVYVPLLVVTPVYGSDPSGSGQRVQVAPSIWTALRDGGGWTEARQAMAGVPLLGSSIPGDCTAQNGLLRFFELNRTRPADFDSLYYTLQRTHIGDTALFPTETPSSACDSPHQLNLVVAVLTILVLAAVVALVVLAPRRPRLPQVLFLAVAGFLLVNKVHSPQYVVWLIPLAALARPRWRAFLVWQAAEIALLVLRFMFFVGQSAAADGRSAEGVGFGWFEAAVLGRDAALLFLIVAVVVEVLRPHRDLVRGEQDDDPAGGVLDGAPDRRGRRARSPAPAAVPA